MSEEQPEKKQKREYRLGNPLSVAERLKRSYQRKLDTHKFIRVRVPNAVKLQFDEMCDVQKKSQSDMFELVILDTYRKYGSKF